MKKNIIFLSLIVASVFFVGCSTGARYHETPLPDPKQFDAHFGDVDTNADDVVSWQEFKGYFPQAESRVFEALDLNRDGFVGHDEWHQFKKAHGLQH